MTQIIALSGYAGVGKDTVADILAENHGFKKLAFADRLKELLLNINPWIHDELAGNIRLQGLIEMMGWDKAKRAYPEVRRLLQRTGMGVREHVDDEHAWITPVIWEIVTSKPEKVVISDLRLENELTALRGIAGDMLTVVRLTRPGIGPANEHVSENTPIPHDVEAPLDSVSRDEMPGYVAGLLRVVNGTSRLRDRNRAQAEYPLWDKFIEEISQARG